ncbi:MAG TPA: CHAT domain-containing protein [Pyrinomonadaceae bacterium]|jgi:CHAT domain-containing protein
MVTATPPIEQGRATHAAGTALSLILPVNATRSIPLQEEGALRLELGKPIEREIAGGRAHNYQLHLAANQYLNLIVDQRGIDVVVSLFGPDGQQLAEVDSPNGAQGPEPVVVVVETSGNYRLEVRTLDKDAAAGKYEVKIGELRAATRQDRDRIAAQRAFAEAEQLSGQDTAESYGKAMQKYDEAIMHFRAAADRQGEATALNNKGLAYFLSGENHQALGYFAQARSIFMATSDSGGEALTLLNFGLVYDELGEMQKALDNYNRALMIFRDLGDRQREAFMLINLGTLYHRLGDSGQSLDLYTRALSLCRSLTHSDCEATALGGIGRTHYTLGDKQKAIDNYNQMLSIYRDMDFPRGQSTALFYLGLAYSDLGERQKALDYYTEVLDVSRKAGFRDTEAATLNKLGVLYANMGEGQKAIEHYKQAVSLFRLMGNRSEEADALYNIARYENGRGALEAARVQSEAALAIVESLRTKIVGEDLRSSYFASFQEYYGFHIDLLMRLHKQQPSKGYDVAALQSNERARARSLLELLTEARADIRQGVDPSLLEHERTLQQRLNAKADRQARLRNTPVAEDQAAALTEEIKALETEIEALTAEYQQVRAQIRVRSPRYAALTQPQPLTLKEIQTQLLDADTLLLEYSLGTDHSYLWAVTPTSIKSYELPKREEIEAAARRFYALTTMPPQQASSATEKRETGEDLQPEDGTRLTQSADQLSRMLLSAVAPLLGQKRLLIVGDGVLQYIPFAALPTPAGARRTAATPLVVEHEIVNLPSASTLAILRSETGARQPAPKTLTVIADPVFERSDERLKTRAGQTGALDAGSPARADEWRGSRLVAATSAKQSGVADADLRIRRLPGTRREAEEIVKLVSPNDYKKALDFAANLATATSPDMGQYRYVHFATHGFLNSQHPALSGIVLSMFDEQGAPQDGFLRAHEIFNLKLTADVVVLSACRTGLGKEIRGEGLVGLTRGFMYAGTPRVVVSLWNVNDAATAELMTRFYRGMLVDKLRPAKALQAAQVSMLKERRYSAPFYWAAFTLQGEWR